MFPSKYCSSGFEVPFSINLSSCPQANGPPKKKYSGLFSPVENDGSGSVGRHTFWQAYLVLFRRYKREG